MHIELERCPQELRALVGEAECVKCGTKPGSGLAAEIRFAAPVYVVRLTCLKCAGRGVITVMGPRPEAPAPVPIAQPDWYTHVEVAGLPLEESS